MNWLQIFVSYARKSALYTWSLILAASMFCPALVAQGDASLWGSVTDGTGAGIAEAAVTVTNIETGTQRTLVTDEAGRFNAPVLPVGHYQVVATKTGFRVDRRTSIILVIGQREELNLKLQVGDVHQTVEVAADLGIVQITTEDISGLVGERQVKELPLNGRSYDQLLTLNPGIVNYTSQRAGGIGTSNSVVGNMFAVSGRRPQENLFLLNGVEFTSASEINNTPGGRERPTPRSGCGARVCGNQGHLRCGVWQAAR